MIETTLTLEAITLEAPGHTGGWVSCPPGLVPTVGQYLLAHAQALNESLPTPLFPAQIQANRILLAPPLPAAWTVGTTLQVRGPLGKGFHLPGIARRVALAGLDYYPHRLLLLISQALEQGAAVALHTTAVPHYLPVEVEILPLELLPESRVWADYLALDLPLTRLTELPRLLGIKRGERLSCTSQALIHTAMPCGGLAECGVCGVPTRRGWKLACKDGPVFDLQDLWDKL